MGFSKTKGYFQILSLSNLVLSLILDEIKKGELGLEEALISSLLNILGLRNL